MELFDRTSVIQGDDQCRDGHYRVKENLLEMAASEDGAEQRLDPNATISLQAQNPTTLGEVKVGSASEEAAGIPAIWNTMLYGIGDMGVMRAPEAFLKIQPRYRVRLSELCLAKSRQKPEDLRVLREWRESSIG